MLDEDFIFSNLYMLYFIIGLLLCIAEMFTYTFYLLPLGLSAILTGISSFFIDNYYIHAGVFGFFTIVFLYILKKVKKSKFLSANQEAYSSGLLGSKGIVSRLEIVSSKIFVKIFADEWEVHFDSNALNEFNKYKIGDAVVVTKVFGNKISIKHLN